MDYAKEDYGVSHTLYSLVPTSILFFPSFLDIVYFLPVYIIFYFLPFCVCDVNTVGCHVATCTCMVLELLLFTSPGVSSFVENELLFSIYSTC